MRDRCRLRRVANPAQPGLVLVQLRAVLLLPVREAQALGPVLLLAVLLLPAREAQALGPVLLRAVLPPPVREALELAVPQVLAVLRELGPRREQRRRPVLREPSRPP